MFQTEKNIQNNFGNLEKFREKGIKICMMF